MIRYSRKHGPNNAYLYKLLPNGEIITLYGIIGRSDISTFFIYQTARGDYKVEYINDFSATIDNNDTLWLRENNFDFAKRLFMDKIKQDIEGNKSIIKTKKSLLKSIRKQESD